MTAATPRALGASRSGEAIQADLARYCQLALELGASAAVTVPADQVSVDERVRLKCTIPRCLRAGETPNCPPHVPDVDLIRRALGRFAWAVLFKCDVTPIEAYAPGSGA
jgi:predicted metal-binding protein